VHRRNDARPSSLAAPGSPAKLPAVIYLWQQLLLRDRVSRT
jgi:hypothetical protein